MSPQFISSHNTDSVKFVVCRIGIYVHLQCVFDVLHMFWPWLEELQYTPCLMHSISLCCFSTTPRVGAIQALSSLSPERCWSSLTKVFFNEMIFWGLSLKFEIYKIPIRMTYSNAFCIIEITRGILFTTLMTNLDKSQLGALPRVRHCKGTMHWNRDIVEARHHVSSVQHTNATIFS